MPEAFQGGAAMDVVAVVRIAAVDDYVPGFEQRHDITKRTVDGRGGNHQPDCPRSSHLLHHVVKRRGHGGACLPQTVNHQGLAAVDDALLAFQQQAPHHAGAHPAQSDHSDLHFALH